MVKVLRRKAAKLTTLIATGSSSATVAAIQVDVVQIVVVVVVVADTRVVAVLHPAL